MIALKFDLHDVCDDIYSVIDIVLYSFNSVSHYPFTVNFQHLLVSNYQLPSGLSNVECCIAAVARC